MRIQASAPRHRDVRTAVRIAILTADTPEEEAALCRLTEALERGALLRVWIDEQGEFRCEEGMPKP